MNEYQSDILIIDDNYEDIVILQNILKTGGYHTRAVRDGSSGLKAAQAITPDLVLMDIVLPDQDGFKVCRQFHEDKVLNKVPIIFVSAMHDINLKVQAFESGGYDYITKPFNGIEVLVRVRHQLERMQLREELEENARLKERYRIARELHDSVNQTLFITSASVQAMMMDQDQLPRNMRDQLVSINVLAQSALAEMRTLLNELRPSHMRDASIQTLLRQLVDAFRLRINAEISLVATDFDLPHDIKLAFYRITQEALNNVAKHASPQHLKVHFMEEPDCVRLIIEDDGYGFDMNHHRGGMGLHTMRERAEQHKIDFVITSSPGMGTRIELLWELTRPGGTCL